MDDPRATHLKGKESRTRDLRAAEARSRSIGTTRVVVALAAACEPVDLAVVRARQAAVKDLAPRVAFRERLSAAGAIAAEGSPVPGGADHDGKPDPSPFLAWAEGAMPLPNAPALAIVAWI